MRKYTYYCCRCRRCLIGFRCQSKFLILRENGGWENIVTWDKGCYLPCALVFAIKIEKMAMEGVEQVAKAMVSADCLENYNEMHVRTMVVNDAKFCSIFRPNWK